MNKDTIVTVVLFNGAELIGKFVEEDFNTIKINKPRMVQANQQGIGLVNGVCMTGKEPTGDFQISKNSVMFMVETVDELQAGYMKQTTGLDLPKKQGIIS